MKPLILDKLIHLFKDKSAFDQFVAAFGEAAQGDLSLVLVDNQSVGAVLSPEAAKEILYERLVKRIASSPEAIDEIRNRIENDDIVD